MAKERKRPLPVALTKEQHKYLDEKSEGKAGYLRYLLEADMRKAKRGK